MLKGAGGLLRTSRIGSVLVLAVYPNTVTL